MTGITNTGRTGPACWFCNSSGFWLTRCFNKHTVIIPTREGAGVADKKAGAPETRTMAAGGTGTRCPPALLGCFILMWHRAHCWERSPPSWSPQDTYSTSVPCYTKTSTDILCAAAEGATHLLPLCRPHRRKVEENEERFYFPYFLIRYYLHIPMVQAHIKEDYRERSWHDNSLACSWERKMKEISMMLGNFWLKKKNIKRQWLE